MKKKKKLTKNILNHPHPGANKSESSEMLAKSESEFGFGHPWRGQEEGKVRAAVTVPGQCRPGAGAGAGVPGHLMWRCHAHVPTLAPHSLQWDHPGPGVAPADQQPLPVRGEAPVSLPKQQKTNFLECCSLYSLVVEGYYTVEAIF